MTRGVAAIHGLYYTATGVWPLVSFTTFEAVTGPKHDDWLVYTVGVLVIAIGLALLNGAREGRIGSSLVILAIASAAGLAVVECVYVLRGVIWPIYMLDAIGEAGLIGLWVAALVHDRRMKAARV
jgi:hypothetical protein